MTRSPLRPLMVLGPAALVACVGAAIAAPRADEPAVAPMTIEPGPSAQPTTTSAPKPIIVPANPQPSLEPVRPGLPPPAAADLGVPSVPGLLREGSYITNAVGQMVRGQSGRWYVVFDPQPSGRTIPPMVLAENSNLAAMERAVDRLEPGTRLRIAGRVTVYRDHNYLLPSMPPMIERTAIIEALPSTTPTDAAPASDMPSEPAKPPTGEPTIDQIVAELDKAVGSSRPRPITPAPRPVESAAATDAAPAEKRIALAGFLTNRKARVIRDADGRLAARFDAGADGATESPMLLLPCQNLAAIETILDAQGENAAFTMSGEVVVYKGKNYLLPTMYLVNKTTDLVMPTQ